MTTLSEILTQYRAGERDLPTYAELLEVEKQMALLIEQAEQLTQQVAIVGGVK